MKRFLISSSIFILAGIALFHVRPFFLLYDDRYKSAVAGKEIYYAIKKSKKKNKSKKLLLGDSVGNQLFDNRTHNDTINSLACNQSISMVGQFILLNNYLNAGNRIDTVYFVLQPFSFQNNLDQVYTFHYFLKPFFTKEYMPCFSKTVTEQIARIPHRKYCRYPSILTSNWAPDFTPDSIKNYTFLSPVSKEYLGRINELALKNNFKLIILPTPISKSRKKEIDKFNKKEISDNILESEFRNYFERILYLEDSNFSDGNHLKVPQKYTEWLGGMLH
jgi:hypothetical protein